MHQQFFKINLAGGGPGGGPTIMMRAAAGAGPFVFTQSFGPGNGVPMPTPPPPPPMPHPSFMQQHHAFIVNAMLNHFAEFQEYAERARRAYEEQRRQGQLGSAAQSVKYLAALGIHNKADWKQWARQNHPDKYPDVEQKKKQEQLFVEVGVHLKNTNWDSNNNNDAPLPA
jgi:hypothetical protein